MLILDYDTIPEAEREGLYFTTWREQGNQHSNVMRRVDGVKQVYWPEMIDGVITPAWAYELVD